MITITVTRKPCSEATIAANVLKHSCGALNIDRSRVGIGETVSGGGANFDAWRSGEGRQDRPPQHGKRQEEHSKGRWPSNLVLGDTSEILDQFPDTKSGGYPPEGNQRSHVSTYSTPNARGERKFTSSEGSAARYFRLVKEDPETSQEES